MAGLQDLEACALPDLAVPAPSLTITESELLCGERLLPESLLPTITMPRAPRADHRLLAFETREATPLCLKPPTAECRKRVREEEEEMEEPQASEDASEDASTTSFIDWHHFA